MALNHCPSSETASNTVPSGLTARPDQPPNSGFGALISMPAAHSSLPVRVSPRSSGFQTSVLVLSSMRSASAWAGEWTGAVVATSAKKTSTPAIVVGRCNLLFPLPRTAGNSDDGATGRHHIGATSRDKRFRCAVPMVLRRAAAHRAAASGRASAMKRRQAPLRGQARYRDLPFPVETPVPHPMSARSANS